LHVKLEDERKRFQIFQNEIQKRVDALSSGRNQDTSNLKEEERSGEGDTSVQPGRSPEEDAYKDAYQTFRQGNWLAAREKFQAFLVLYPASNLADNAQFWIGESFYNQNEYERAIVEYEKVIQGYAQGDKVSSALLKQAFAFDALGQIKEARILLEQVIRKFPQSEQTQIARKKLESIGREGGTRP
jgi:tol-pal system protein YbgF